MTDHNPLDNLKAIDPPFLYTTYYLRSLEKIPTFNININLDWSSMDFNQYRAHNWQCWGGYPRSPYAHIFTSLGCPFKCKFCSVENYYGEYRQRDINLVIQDFYFLHRKGVKNIRVLDEMFFLDYDRVKKICDTLVTLDGLNLWAYSRVDTIRLEYLPLIRKSGFRWICLGIESGNEEIRQDMNKGIFNNNYIKAIVAEMKKSDINVLGNFMFGFPNDNFDTMKQTLDLAMELNCEYSNFYSMMAYPNSEMEKIAKENGWTLPQKEEEYSQYSYECHPLQTKYLTSAEVLKFRDNAFHTYHTSDRYLSMMKKKFGDNIINEINEMTKYVLKRKLYD